jgi:hypothetical protein
MAEPVPIADVAKFPKGAGIYLVYSTSRIGWLSWNPAAGPAYVGKAADGLQKRIRREHYGDTGRSTLRRTLGAILKATLDLVARPRPGRGELKPINFTNYTFEADGDSRLTWWMGEHLSIEYRLTSQPKVVEDELMAQHQPPLNLTGWLNPFASEIKAARKICAEEARNQSQR